MVSAGEMRLTDCMAPPQPVIDPSRTIYEFVVYRTDGGWLAVHKEDPAIVFERADWRQLHFACIGVRVRRSLFANYGER